MSNVESRPLEQTVCDGPSTASDGSDTALLDPREVPLGGPRAMLVRRNLPGRYRRMVGAWCFADAFGPTDLTGTPGMQVPPHPHTGLQTVSWLLDGEVLHQDSLGSRQLVRPGQLGLMTAGAGIAHSEQSPPEGSRTLHGVQLWIAQPESDRNGQAHFDHHAALPTLVEKDGEVTVVMGELAGATSPARTYTPLVGADVRLRANGRLRLPLEPEFEHAVLALGGPLTVGGHATPGDSMRYLGCGRRELLLESHTPNRALLIGGLPFEEHLVMWWDILAGAHDLTGARRLAQHFVTASIDESNSGDFWFTAAANTLTALFLAAARGERPVTEVTAWLASPADRTPIDLLTDAGLHAVAAQLQGTVAGAVETRDGIFENARQYAACLLDPHIAAWVTPPPHASKLGEFKPEEFSSSRDTLYLLSKDGGGSASAIIAAAADAVMRAAVIQAERDGGRLDPPLLAILDEAANVCKIQDLPDLYSHLGSRGIIPITILQSYRQGQRVWGETGMDTLWSAATIKLIGSGIDDADFTDKLSRLIGDHDVPTRSVSTSESGKSSSISMRQERVLPPDRIRSLPKGSALLLATGIRPALLDLKPWYREPDADHLSTASQQATNAITDRALAKDQPTHFGPNLSNDRPR